MTAPSSRAFGKWEPIPKQDLSEDEVSAALLKNKGRYSHAALELGCSARHLNLLVKASPDLQELIKEINNLRIDKAEDTLDQAIAQGATQLGLQASLFMLRTKGANRGFVTRTEVTGKDGNAIETNNTSASETAQTILKALADIATHKSGEFQRGGDKDNTSKPRSPDALPPAAEAE